ncbi:S-adenosylmethionine sensor upstream of mTORC1-like [Dreissena polymorpha]|uniref:S-adenosylmethionine sensor upstream of mTORC1-like n=1 Tax=Dreissena polymorpha TaxID=45954 RepID=UPI002264278D|nr:S-adenosylmethionine sensor upstream of mTORC1-like [Dreissena polymorpha]
MTDSESVSSGTNFLERRARERWLSETECHEEHLRLADYVKGVHADLRKKFKSSSGEGDLERIWIEHCGNKTVLSQYADAMHTLATEHWTKNQETRIDWCREVTHEYFMKGGLQKVLDKERESCNMKKPKKSCSFKNRNKCLF